MSQPDPCAGLRGDNLVPPPSNVDAEQALLGAILTNNKAFDLTPFLRPEMFAVEAHRWLYQQIKRQIEAGINVTPVTLRNELLRSPQLEPVGGIGYVAKLLDACVGIINAPDYGWAIKDAWERRTILDLTTQARSEVLAGEGLRTGDILHRLETGLLDLAGVETKRTVWSGGDAAAEAISEAENAFKSGTGIIGASTGFRGLDDALGGLEEGTFNVIAGRPGQGKTGAALGIAVRSAVKSGLPTLYWSGEMSAKSLTRRLIAAWTGISVNAIRTGYREVPSRYSDGETERVKLTQRDFDALVEAERAIHKLPLFICDQSAISVTGLQAVARGLARKHGKLGLVVVDYLDLMSASSSRLEQTAKTTEISQGLLHTGKSLGVPMLILQQLNREVDKRDDKRPTLSDLRNSGQIEQDADSVTFIYREHYYLSKQKPERRERESEMDFLDRESRWRDQLEATKDKAEFLNRKNRHGEVRDIPMRFDGPRTWFSDLSEREGARPW